MTDFNYRNKFETLLIEAAQLAIEYKAGGYGGLRADYKRTVKSAVDDYLTSTDRATSYISTVRKSAVESFTGAFGAGYTDGGGDENDIDQDADQWLTDRINQEVSFIGELFTSLKALRDEYIAGEIKIADLRSEAATRADGYTDSLDAVYNSGKMWGMKNKMLTWRLGSTEKHCKTCLSLDGNSHRASWYLARNYIPRKPGANLECGGYNCDCTLLDSLGNEITI